MNRAAAIGGTERAVKHRQVLGPQAWRTLDGVVLADEVNDALGGRLVVTQPRQRLGDTLVGDLEHAATDETLVLHQRDVGLDAGGVTVHHEADGSRWCQHCSLGIAIAVLGANRDGLVPRLTCRREQVIRTQRRVDVVDVHAVLLHDAQERLAVLRVTSERAGHIAGNLGAHAISAATHQGRDRPSVSAPRVGVIRQTARHQQRAKVRVAQAQGPESMAVLANLFRWVARSVNDDLLRQDGQIDCTLKGGDVKVACLLVTQRELELAQVQAGQVASTVVEEHILRAGIAGIDAVGVGAGVPSVDDRVKLHARIATLMRSVSNLPPQVARLIRIDDRAGSHRLGLPLTVMHHRFHKGISHAHRVIGVLEEDRVVGLAVELAVVASVDKRPGFALLGGLAVDVLDDIGMLDVEYHHLGRAAGLATGLDDARKRVKALHKRHRAGSAAAAI